MKYIFDIDSFNEAKNETAAERIIRLEKQRKKLDNEAPSKKYKREQARLKKLKKKPDTIPEFKGNTAKEREAEAVKWWNSYRMATFMADVEYEKMKKYDEKKNKKKY